jgi:hypothetical protein
MRPRFWMLSDWISLANGVGIIALIFAVPSLAVNLHGKTRSRVSLVGPAEHAHESSDPTLGIESQGAETSKSIRSSNGGRAGSTYVKRVAPRDLRSRTCTTSSGTLSASFGEGFARTKDTAPGVTDLAASIAAPFPLSSSKRVSRRRKVSSGRAAAAGMNRVEEGGVRCARAYKVGFGGEYAGGERRVVGMGS